MRSFTPLERTGFLPRSFYKRPSSYILHPRHKWRGFLTGFTLLELIVVIIIIGVLASIGFGQYTKVVEKARATEARGNLASLRQLQMGYYHDKRRYGDISDLGMGLPDMLSYECADEKYYFNYSCATDTGTCYALRCESGGKDPNNKPDKRYYISLSVNGEFSGTSGWH